MSGGSQLLITPEAAAETVFIRLKESEEDKVRLHDV
jgi:hypothetical protein